jgi:fatty-acyl-CoA synthase
VKGLMMDFQLTIPAVMRRADQLFGPKEIVSRLPDRSFHRYTYADFIARTKRLAVALRQLGVQPGDRVATLCWNHHQHLEAYFAIPSIGAVLHTLNLRLHPNDLTYIVNHAEDKVLICDKSLLPLLDRFRSQVALQNVIVVGDDADRPSGTLAYEQLLAGADARAFSYLDLDEYQAAAMCYTSGTTGRPKGVVYSHRAIVLHTLGVAMADTLAIRESDVTMPVVPMFHVNAWGLPVAATFVGAKQVYPGPFLDPASLLEDLHNERVTFTAGVPTIWLGILQVLDKSPGTYDLSHLRAMAVGGSAAPPSMIRGFQERHGLNVLHAWGMTEMTPIGTVANVPSDLLDAPEEVRMQYRTTQGRPVPLVEIRARGDSGFVPWDGETMGELEVRGPWIASAYYNSPGSEDRFTDDGWFMTGDIVTIDDRGFVKIQDRSKDVIKSGGEWISSVELENALMGHPAVAEAAVIAIADPVWQERPLAAVVLKPGQSATSDELRAFLAPQFAKWWIPEAIEFVDQIPKTSVGKFLKSALREHFKDYRSSKA